MLSTAFDHTTMNYIQSDVPPGQTLREWRRQRERERRANHVQRRRRIGFDVVGRVS